MTVRRQLGVVDKHEVASQPNGALASDPIVVHLPVYRDNSYQPSLMSHQEQMGWKVVDGGGGGNFLRSVALRWKPDVVHFHWLHPYLLRPSSIGSWLRGIRFLWEVRLIRLGGAKIVWTVHNLTNHGEHHPSIERSLTRRFTRLCDLVLTHGQFAAQQARQQFNIPPSTPVVSFRHPNYCQEGQLPEPPTKSPNTPEIYRFGFLGRVEPYKQVVQLVEAFLETSDSNGRLVIAGKASQANYARKVQAAIGDDPRIEFDNQYIPESDIPDLMKRIDVVVCPSENILTSGSVVLGISYGRPVIAPNDGCIPEEVGDTGFLYDNHPGELAKTMRLARSRRDEWERLGQKAYQRAIEASPRSTASKILDAYQSLLSPDDLSHDDTQIQQ